MVDASRGGQLRVVLLHLNLTQNLACKALIIFTSPILFVSQLLTTLLLRTLLLLQILTFGLTQFDLLAHSINFDIKFRRNRRHLLNHFFMEFFPKNIDESLQLFNQSDED